MSDAVIDNYQIFMYFGNFVQNPEKNGKAIFLSLFLIFSYTFNFSILQIKTKTFFYIYIFSFFFEIAIGK